MLVSEFAKLMDWELLLPDMAGREIVVSGCYIGDLLSNVMGKAAPGQIWLTVMTNINVLAVAQLLELPGIVLVEGNQPGEGVLDRAVREDIPVFQSKESAYEAAVRLYKSGLL